MIDEIVVEIEAEEVAEEVEEEAEEEEVPIDDEADETEESAVEEEVAEDEAIEEDPVAVDDAEVVDENTGLTPEQIPMAAEMLGVDEAQIEELNDLAYNGGDAADLDLDEVTSLVE